MSDEQVAPAADPAEQAMVELEAHQADDAFMQRYLGGDKASVEQMKALYERAHPEPTDAGEDSGKRTRSDAAPATQTAFSDALAAGDARSSDPMDVAREAAFAPARGPWEFDLQLFGPNQTAEQTGQEMGLKQALYDSGMPVATANVFRELGKRNVERGIYGDPEKIEAGIPAEKVELARQHGADAAGVIADASRAFDAIAERSPLIWIKLWDAGLDSTADGVKALARWWRGTRGGA